jgi:hypothetical protein
MVQIGGRSNKEYLEALLRNSRERGKLEEKAIQDMIAAEQEIIEGAMRVFWEAPQDAMIDAPIAPVPGYTTPRRSSAYETNGTYT